MKPEGNCSSSPKLPELSEFIIFLNHKDDRAPLNLQFWGQVTKYCKEKDTNDAEY